MPTNIVTTMDTIVTACVDIDRTFCADDHDAVNVAVWAAHATMVSPDGCAFIHAMNDCDRDTRTIAGTRTADGAWRVTPYENGENMGTRYSRSLRTAFATAYAQLVEHSDPAMIVAAN